ncbi:MAG: AsmA family protein [Alteromonadaceae bacterium]|nr:AsmA family protein [Alteromonadaceae bacterium]
MNKLATLAITILLICGGALWFLASGSLNEFIKAQIEIIGHENTKQKVVVGNVDIQLSKGSGKITDIVLYNPPGYSYPHVFSLEKIGLDINIESLTEEPIIIDEIIIDKPQAFVEFTKTGGSNIKDLLDIIKENSTGNTEELESSPSTTEQPKIRIEKLVLSSVVLSLNLTELGNKEHQFTLPDINLLNIGGKSGLPADQLGTEIIKQTLTAIGKQATEKQKNEIKDKLKIKLKDKLKEKLGKTLKDIFG